MRELGLLRDQREDAIDELTDFVARAWELMCMLTQSVVPVGNCEALSGRVTTCFTALAGVVSASRFMSTDERRLAGKVTDTLASLSRRLQDDNPKAEALAECLSGGSDWTLICHSAQSVLETRAYWASNDARTRFPTDRQTPETIAFAAASGATITSPAIVVGWLGKRRMPELLHPPVSPSLTLLLYDFESAWYYGLQHMCEEARRNRGGHGTRHRLLGFEGVWHRDSAAETSPVRSGDTEVHATDSDDFDDVMTEYRRARAIAYARIGDKDEPDVDATIHWFGNDLCAFLTSKYKAKVVTHLIEESAPSEGTTKSEVRLAECRDLSVGDYLLFHRGSDADAIRVTADEILKSPSFRRTARLWQRALHRFRDQEGLTPRIVWERLKANGCDHHLITIKHWLTDDEMIAPRDAHTHELEIIATVTGDAELRARMSECKAAITKVWGAHLAASHHLATNVIIKVAHSLAGGSAITDAGLLEIAPSVLLTRIVGIEPDTVSVKRSMTNQIIEESNG